MTELSSMSGPSRLLSKEISQRPQKVIDHSDYVYKRIVQNNNGTSVTLTSTGGQESVFTIPGSYVFNLFQSYFKFDEVQNTNVGADNIIYRFADLIPHIQRLQITTQRGQVLLCDVPDCHKYTNAILRYETRLDDMLTNEQPVSGGIYEGLMPPQKLVQGITTTACNMTAPGNADATIDVKGKVDAAVDAVMAGLSITAKVPNTRHQNQDSKNSLIEPLYYLKSSAANTTLPLKNRLPLSLFKNTICGVNKNRYFGDAVDVKITWNSTKFIYFLAGATPIVKGGTIGGVDTPLDPGNLLVLSNLELQLCVENNTLIVNDMKTKFANEGFAEFIPFLYHVKQSRNGQLQNIAYDISRSMGMYLQKILWIPCNPVETTNNKYYHGTGATYLVNDGTTTADGAIVDFNPRLNSNNIYPSAINISTGEHYLLQRSKLKGSCITSRDDYNYNFTWYQEWTEISPLWMKPLEPFDNDVYLDGYLVTDPVKYEIDVNLAGGAERSHYLYIVMLRQLTVTKDAVVLQ